MQNKILISNLRTFTSSSSVFTFSSFLQDSENFLTLFLSSKIKFFRSSILLLFLHLGHACKHTFQICSNWTERTFCKVCGDFFHTLCFGIVEEIGIATIADICKKKTFWKYWQIVILVFWFATNTRLSLIAKHWWSLACVGIQTFSLWIQDSIWWFCFT